MIEKPPVLQVLQSDVIIDEPLKEIITDINNNYYYWSENIEHLMGSTQMNYGR